MRRIQKSFVNIDELMEAVGRRIAELTGAEAAIVTSGCTAALCHATAAALTGADPEKMLRLPNTDGLQAKVIMLTTGRFTYDHAIRMVGSRIVEVESREEFLREIEDGAVLVALLGAAEENGKLRLSDIAPIARKKGMPVLVDAAAEIPQRPNPFLSRGASMVAYRGGKYLRGPQCSGLLLGEERWIRAAWMHSAPHHTFGRPMKIGKEEIMGLLAALEVWAERRRVEDEKRIWDADLETISAKLTQLPSVTTRRLPQMNSTDLIPKMEVSWDFAQLPALAMEVRSTLLNGTPRIMLDDRGSSDTSLLLLPFSMQPGEARVVGEAIHRVLSESMSRRGATSGSAGQAAEPIGVKIDGRWDLEISFAVGSAQHRVDIESTG
ncbi:MAG: aminotransferase class V-fold PLP-dependent enzyme, partial [Phycisphaerales bacterium]|nr:aminotransferase class V-fold PLP-dependent enzyme [Phycisphaerales bacterium]